MELERLPRGANSHRTKRQRQAEEIEVLSYKVRGWSDVAIAEKMRMSLPTVNARFKAGLAQHGQKNANDYRGLIAQRYEVLVRAAMEEAENGGGLPAIEAAARITKMYETLLGVTAPAQVQVEVHQVSEQEMALREMLAQAERDEKVRETVIVEGEVVADA